MATKIIYIEVPSAPRPTFRTAKYSGLLSDTVQGEVYQDIDDGTWSGWFINHDGRSKFKLGMGSKSAAVRWVNAQLRDFGVK